MLISKIKNIVLKTTAIIIFLTIILSVYFYFAIKIDVPIVSNGTTLNWKRDSISSGFYKVKANWLKHTSSGLWEP